MDRTLVELTGPPCYGKCFQVKVFATDNLEGTNAVVLCTKVEPFSNYKQDFCADVDADACCIVWPVQDQLCVECFNHGIAIQFCGHGLLASAAAWRAYESRELPLIVQSHGKRYAVSDDESRNLWLTTSRVTCRRVPYPQASYPQVSYSPVTACFNISPARVAEAGGETDYLILEWPPGFDPAELTVDLDRLCLSTARAVIATSRALTRQALASDNVFYLRYFAPQYGNAEGRVTGSAAMVLASYWGCEHARFEQRSAGGGEIFTRLAANSSSISGNIAIEPYR